MKKGRNELMNEWMNEWMHEWMNEWIYESMNQWMNEWMNEWMKTVSDLFLGQHFASSVKSIVTFFCTIF